MTDGKVVASKRNVLPHWAYRRRTPDEAHFTVFNNWNHKTVGSRFILQQFEEAMKGDTSNDPAMALVSKKDGRQ